MNSSERHWTTQVRSGICALWILVLVLFEGYTAGGMALDRSTRVPAWESSLGWFLFVLPCELLVALAVLLRRQRRNLGFRLVAANVLVYALLMYFWAVLDHEGLTMTTLEVAGFWVTFFVLAIGAAHLLRNQAASN